MKHQNSFNDLTAAKQSEFVNANTFVDYIPLCQTILWIAFAIWLIYFFRVEIGFLRAEMITRIKAGGGVKIGVFEMGELRNDLKDVKRDLNQTNDRIFRLFITTMGSNMYVNLKKMTSGNFGKFDKSKGLVRELYYLRDLGYIEIPSISNIPELGDQLSLYLSVTETGREFIKLREELIGD